MLSEKERQLLLKEIDDVIKDLENRYSVIQLETGMLNLIYTRYAKSYAVITAKKEAEEVVYINGSVRAYLDSYSDWDNPLLAKMGKVEELYRKYIMKL